jgi:FkbM family methyltransferase
LTNIKTFNIALGDFNGKSKINKYEFHAASSLLRASQLSRNSYPYIGSSLEEEITVERLDDFIIEQQIKLQHNILIKMDVQGFEDKVIKGGCRTIAQSKIIITEVEFHELYEGQVLFDGIYDQLGKLGFSFKGIISTSLNPNDGLPLFADAVFIRQS